MPDNKMRAGRMPLSGWIRQFFSRLGKQCRLFFTLVMMQLKEKMDMSYLSSKKKTLFKTVWLLVEIAAISAICYVLLYAVRLLGVFSLVGDIPDTVMNVVFTVMMALSVIFTTVGLVKSLYFSRDNMVLLTFPVTPSTVFMSKLTVYYCYEFRKNFMFMIPLFAAYGIVKNYPWIYYPWLLLMFVLISALPVIVAALLSIPCMFLYQWIRRVKALQYVLYALAAGAVIGAVLYLISLIPENIDLGATWGTTFWEIQSFLAAFSRTFSFMYKFTQLIVGRSTLYTVSVFTVKTVPYFFLLVGVCVGLLVISLLSSRPLFYKMASKPFEYSKKANPKEKRNVPKRGFLSALKKDTSVGLRSNSLINTAVWLWIVLPIGIELLNSLYSAMNTRLLGLNMTVSFNALIILLVLTSTNIEMASCYSRDGAASYLNKIQPTPCEKLLVAKLVPNLFIGFIGTAGSIAVYAGHSAMSPLSLVLLGVTVYLFYAAHLFWSAESDIMNPQYEQYATFNNQGNNPNENHSALLAFLLSFAVFAASLLLSFEDGERVWIKAAIVAVAICAFKVVTYLMKISAFYKEK